MTPSTFRADDETPSTFKADDEEAQPRLPYIPRPPLPPELMGEQELREYRGRPLGPEEQRMFERPIGAPEDFGPTIGGGVGMARGAADIVRARSLREAAGGLHELAGGAFEAATPLIPGSLAAAPLRTLGTLALGTAAYEGTRAGLKALGLPEEYADVAGDLAAAIIPAAGLPAYDRMLLRARIRSVLQDRLNAEYAQRQAQERAYRGGRLLEAGEPSTFTPDEPAPAPTRGPGIQEAEFEDIGGGPPAPTPEPAAAGLPAVAARPLLRGATPGEPRPVIALPGEVEPRTFEMPPVAARPPEAPPEPVPAAETPSTFQPDQPAPTSAPSLPVPGKMGLHLNENSNGTFSFVGTVPGELGYVRESDGQPPTDRDLHNARQAGPGIAGLGTRVWPTAAEALQAARDLGYEPANAARFEQPQAAAPAPASSPTPEPIQPAPEPPIAQPEPSETIAPTAEAPTSYTEPKTVKPSESDTLTPQMGALVEAIKSRIASGEGWKDGVEFQRFAKEHLGGSLAEGAFEMRDIYDAAETAMNEHLAEIGPDLLREPVEKVVPQLQELTNLLPTQTVRSAEQQAFQQYSTPPALSYLTAKAADIQPGETVLEPSAGTGSLAVWAKAAGAKVETNELAPRRRALLKWQEHEPTGFNAEHIQDLRPDLKPDVVIMNPPFSASAGRLSGKSNLIGFNHVLAALDALKPGGRLVAILGSGRPGEVGGAHPQATAAAPLWQGISRRGAHVLANIGMSGKNYQKYGTKFDNRIVVIDKTPRTESTPAPITGDYQTIEEGYRALQPILGRRAALARGPGEGAGAVAGGPGHLEPVPTGPPRADQGGTGGGGLRGRQRPGRGGVQPAPEAGAAGRPAPAATGGPPAPVEPPGEREPAVSGEGARGSDYGEIETGKRAPLATEEEGTFASYQPAKMRSGVSHQKATGTALVETGAMAAVEPPDITYRPSLPKSVIDSGRISDAQLESIVYAGQAHDTKLPSGLRGGYMNGDGTGVGKGTIAAGIVLDNWNKGRKKALWVSLKSGLIKQAQRDLDWINSGIQAKMANDWGFGDKIDHEGVIFSSYAMLHQTSSDQSLPSRLDQLIAWNPDVIIFDESHAAKNAVGTEIYNDPNDNQAQRNMFSSEGTKAGASVLDLDKKLPDSRIAYFSATAFTDVRNLGYANRLGLWGPGSDFPSFRDFMVEIERGGLGAMELVAREMKTLGRYTARQISFHGVTYREAEAKLTPAQRKMYDGAVEAWQTILANIDDAIDASVGEGNGRSQGLARMRALKDFWNRNLSFYRQLITTMKVPTIISEIDKALSENKSVFIDLVSTGEAESQRQFAGALQSGADFADIDMSAKQMIYNYLDRSFPIYVMEDYEDENGVTKSRYVLDDKGNKVVNQAALQIRERLKEGLESIQLPKSPMDELIDAYGTDQIAEISGRKSRIVEDPKTGKPIEAKRVKPKGAPAKDVNEWERQNFMSGKKRIAIASGAGGTGFDFHSDKRVQNQQKRVHITIEPSWSADQQMQKFGRTHRTNQVTPPEYVMVATDLGGEKRFISAIASRLESLGALTRGERKATGAGEVLNKYNVESAYGQSAVNAVLGQIARNQQTQLQDDVVVRLAPLPPELQEIGSARIMQLLGMAEDQTSAPVSQFLNRVLNLPTNVQPLLFDHFMRTFEDIVQRLKEAGVYDEGTLQLKALSTKVTGDEVVRENPPAPPTRHVTVNAEFPIKYTPWEDAQAHIRALRDTPGAIARNRRSGMLWAVRRAQTDATDPTTGQMVPTASAVNVRGNHSTFPWANLTRENYEIIPREQQKDTWEKEIAGQPKTEHEDVHIITGSILGVWKTLSQNSEGWRIPIVSVRGKGDQPITGVRLPADTAQDTVDMLAGRADFSPTAIFRNVWDRGNTQSLSGGLRLQKTRMMGEPSLTITGGTPQAQRQLASVSGLRSNETAAGTRYYIPIAANPTETQRAEAVSTLGEVLRLFPPAAAEGMQQRRGTERGAVTPEFLTAGLASLLNPEGPRSNYSGLGALEDKFIRNLSQLERASREAHTAAIRAASSRAQAATILRAAVPAIQKALEGSEFTWPELRLALIESRLRGLRERWNDLAEQVADMSDKDLDKAFDHLNDLLSVLEDKQGLPNDLAQSAAALKEAGDRDTLRKFISRHFREASNAVATAMDPDWYRDVTSDPKVQDALGVYKRLVEKPMAENHSLNEGVFSDALGPLNTYYPLIPVERTQPQPPGRRLPYHKPRNIANKFATGLSRGYDATMEAFRDRLAAAVRGNDKAALLKILQEEGLLSPAAPGQQTFEHNGQVYDGERVEISAARQIIKDGKSFYTPARVGIMPRWLARELRPILEGQRLDPQTALGRILQAVNTFALAGPADFVFHSSNLLGTLVANTPFLENSIAGKLASAPLLKKFTAMAKVLSTDPTTEESAADLIEMAKAGVVPDRYGSVTFSKRVAEELGAERKRFSFSPLLFGPKGLDVRARLVMWRLAKSINPGATPQQLYHFVNQLGNYVPALQAEVERSLKSSGFSPFFTAGSTMLRNGINAWTGAGPMPADGWSLRAWQQITGGAIAMLVLWALTYKQVTGVWPWQDRKSKLLQIPVTGSLRSSTVGRALWGPGSEPGYLNFGFFNPLVLRGGRAMGLPGAYETANLRGSAGQVMEAAQRDILNAIAHPALGPAARALFVGATGEEPYITGLRDRRGQVGISFYPAIPPKTPAGLPALGARALAAAREANAFYGQLGEAAGILGADRGQKGNHYVRMMVDLVAPGAVSNTTNPYKRAEMLRQQRTGTR